MVWRPEDAEGNEAGKIKYRIVPYLRGTGLDLGCGPWPVWPHCIGVDNFDEWTSVDNWHPDVIADVTKLTVFADNSMDFVFSSHLLEHLEDPARVLREWWRVLKPGGHLVLYLPHKGFYPNIGEEGSNPDHHHDFLPNDILDFMTQFAAFDAVVNEDRNEGAEYSFLQVYKKLSGKRIQYSYTKPRPPKKLLLIRYGGIGDMIQAASILPALKEQGWHITMNTTPAGQNLLRHDPHIDDWWIQDRDQVPNVELSAYWTALSQEFDRTINLSESVEGTLLAIPGRRTHVMPKHARHMMMDVNYQDFVHALADAPMPSRQKFYPSRSERQKAAAWRKKHLGSAGLILWALAGSSVHKVWPWLDKAIDVILSQTEAHIMFVGDPKCQILELAVLQTIAKNRMQIGYDQSDAMGSDGIIKILTKNFWSRPRIHCMSGRQDIRDTLTFALGADIVVGPETGVLNAVALEESVRKVVMLSHSTHENLTKHWTNTVALAAAVPCYPCHRLHYDAEFCPRDDETGASLCAAAIKPSEIVTCIAETLDGQASGRTFGPEIRTLAGAGA